LLVGGGAGAGLAALFITSYRWSVVEFGEPGSVGLLGAEVFGNWVLPFEVLSILLLAALVGAIIVSRPDIGASR
jgi:NADH:ubiquinone oxidoreductase subunit 6 (subunit J)